MKRYTLRLTENQLNLVMHAFDILESDYQGMNRRGTANEAEKVRKSIERQMSEQQGGWGDRIKSEDDE